MIRVAVLNVVGLTEFLLSPQHTPQLWSFRQRNHLCRVEPAFPAVTCTAQANYLTGQTASRHGIVGNGWYNRELAEVQFWKQSNHLVQAQKLWEELRQTVPNFTCAKLFWWFNMYSSADWSITPRPIYTADGRKIFDIYTHPYSIRPAIKKDIGEFPFATFWGPAAGVETPAGPPDAASRWIADAARWIEEKYQPDLSLIYLPHLDYNFQRFGPPALPGRDANFQSARFNPEVAMDLKRVDKIAGELITFLEGRGVQPVVVSEYGITAVSRAVHLNRLFREQGWLSIKDELGREMLDCGACRVFAVADHQIAHVYLNDTGLETVVRNLLERTEGISTVLGAAEKKAIGLEHPRAGDLVAVAEENSWFSYYYWNDDRRAPDFARTVDIHRKPGYDPVELFLDASQPFLKGKILWRLLQKRLGFRMLMDVIPLDAGLVGGSHGCRPANPLNYPVFIGPKLQPDLPVVIKSTDVHGLLKRIIL